MPVGFTTLKQRELNAFSVFGLAVTFWPLSHISDKAGDTEASKEEEVRHPVLRKHGR